MSFNLIDAENKIMHFLSEHHIASSPIDIVRGQSGSNNRNYHIKTAHQDFLLKEYFVHPDDSRDRMQTEWAFSHYAFSVAPHAVPKPYYVDVKNHFVLFDYIHGTSFHNTKITWNEVEKAIAFFLEINRDRQDATHLPIASDAAFSIEVHIQKIEARLAKLNDIKAHEKLQSILHIMNTKWRAIQSALGKTDAFLHHSTLSQAQYCLSPSDFGFHNALKKENGEIVFFDFEYAGWDDPAKMACDFFTQVQVPVPFEFFEKFLSATMVIFPDHDRLIDRAIVLRSLFIMKWCCIVLNVFLPTHFSRRQFANGAEDQHALCEIQLYKAQHLLESINE